MSKKAKGRIAFVNEELFSFGFTIEEIINFWETIKKEVKDGKDTNE